HRRSLRLERRGLRSRSLFGLASENLAEARRGKLLGLALVVFADVPGRHRLALPAADLHDHLERHSTLLEAFRRVSAGAVLDEVAEPCLGELCAKYLVAAVPREFREAAAVAIQKERPFALEIYRPLAAPVWSLDAEIVPQGALGLFVERDQAVRSGFGLCVTYDDVTASLAVAFPEVGPENPPNLARPHRCGELKG